MTSTSTSTTPALRIAGPGDILTVADIVTEAFDPLKVIHYLVPNPALRPSRSRAWYGLHIAHAIGGAGQVVMTEDGSAAAVWFDRTGEASEPEDYEKHLAQLADDDLAQFLHLERQMDAYHPRDPHWHLLFAAVRPGRQNEGLGSLLLDHTHKWLDKNGYAAYLEATGEDNERLYQTHGYQLMTPPGIKVADGVPNLRRMWRPVQNG